MRDTSGTDVDPARWRASRRGVRTVLFGVGLALGGALLASCEPAPTCGATWTGPPGGLFGEPANWSGGLVPGSTERACAPEGSSILVDGHRHVGSAALDGTVLVPGGSRLSIDAAGGLPSTIRTLDVDGRIDGAGSVSVLQAADLSGQAAGSGELLLHGPGPNVLHDLIVGEDRGVSLTGATISGSVRICEDAGVRANFGDVALAASASIHANGCIGVGTASFGIGEGATVHPQGAASVTGVAFSNAGLLDVDAGPLTIDLLTQTAGRTELVVPGLLRSSGTPGSAVLDLAGGELVGAGVADVTVNGSGTVAPGVPGATEGGVLQVAEWNPTIGAVLALEIDAAGPFGRDRLAVTGNAHIGSAGVTVDVRSGGTVPPGVSHRMLEAEAVVGTWAWISLDPTAGVRWSDHYGGYAVDVWSVGADECAPGVFGPGAVLAGGFFGGCDLTGAILRDANLINADLERANLTNADLRGADLTGARLTGVTWNATLCPDGFDSNLAGGTCEGHLVLPKTFVVTTTADAPDAVVGNGACVTAAGQCSLRAAVQETNAWTAAVPDVIELSPGANYPLSLNGGDDAAAVGDLDVTGALTINGHGATISNAGLVDRLTELRAGPFRANDLSITGANAANDGAAMYIQAGVSATLVNVTMSGNRTTQGGGAIRVADSAASPGAIVTLNHSSLVDNRAATGGAIMVGDNNMLAVFDSVLRDNQATNGWGGAIFSQRSAVIDRTEVSANTATGSGGGVYVASGMLTLRNSTVSGNTGVDGSGIRLWDGVNATVSHATVSNNSGASGGLYANPTAFVQFNRTVMAGQASGPDCGGAFARYSASSYNVEAGTSCGFTGVTNLQSTNPMLKPLAANGGLGRTQVPWADSPIIGRVPNGTAGCGASPTEDQRGVARAQGAGCEPGAVEWVAGESTASDCNAGTAGVGSKRQYCNLTGANFYRRDLAGADFTGADLSNTQFTEARVGGTNFTGAKVSGGYFDWTFDFNSAIGFRSTAARGWKNLTLSGGTNPDLSGVNLTGVDLDGMYARNINLSGAILATPNIDVYFDSGTLVGADFTGADLDGALLYNTPLTGADFTGASIAGANFSGSASLADATGVLGTLVSEWRGTCFCSTPAIDLRPVDLSGRDLTNASFGGSIITGIDMSGADLDGAQISNAGGADLSGVSAVDASFGGDLTGMSLAVANLTNARISGATLTGVDFTGATVRSLKVEYAGTLSNAIGFRTTAANGWDDLDLLTSTVDLSNSDLRGVDMTNARFGIEEISSSVNLSGSDLTGANMTGAFFARANLSNTTGINTVTGIFAATDWAAVNLTGSGIDFSGKTITGKIFRNANFTGVNFTGATIYSVSWYGAKVTGADFSGAAVSSDGFFASTAANSWEGTNFSGGALQVQGSDLAGANMRGANLAGAGLQNTTLTGADMTGAKITGARFTSSSGLSSVIGLRSTVANSWADVDFTITNVDLSGTDLTGANLRGIKLGNEELVQIVNLSGANFTGADLTGAFLARGNFTNATGLTASQLLSAGTGLQGVNLTGTGLDLSGQDLQGRQLGGAKLNGVNLSGANLTGVSAYNVTWTGANLTGADITGTSLGGGIGLAQATGFKSTAANDWTGTFLSSLDLTGIDLSGTDLRSAYWNDTNFTNANLAGANLSGNPSFRTGTFTGATWTGATCPDATSATANGGTCAGHLALTRAAVGSGGTFKVSANGTTWIDVPTGVTEDLFGLTKGLTQAGEFGQPLWMAVGAGGRVITARTDYPGFFSRTYGTQNLYSVGYNGSQYVTVGAGGTIYAGYFYTSLSAVSSGTTSDLYSVTWTGSRWVAVGAGGVVRTSTNGTSWTAATNADTTNLHAVTSTGTRVVAVGNGGVVRVSTDGGLTWVGGSSFTSNSLNGIAWNGVRFTTVGANGTIATSLDGLTWTLRTSGSSEVLFGVIATSTQAIAVGSSAAVLTSPDSITWSGGGVGTVSLRAVAFF